MEKDARKIIGSNIARHLDLIDRPKNWLAKKIDKEPASVTRYIQGETNLNIVQLLEISDFLNCTLYDLLDGIEKEDYDQFAERQEPYKKGIPYYNIPIHAGENSVMLKEAKPISHISIPGVRGIAAFDIVGSSMKGEIEDGSFIVVDNIDSYEKLNPSKIYMIITKDDRMAKRLYNNPDKPGYITALSNNYPDFDILIDDILKVYRIVFNGVRL